MQPPPQRVQRVEGSTRGVSGGGGGIGTLDFLRHLPDLAASVSTTATSTATATPADFRTHHELEQDEPDWTFASTLALTPHAADVEAAAAAASGLKLEDNADADDNGSMVSSSDDCPPRRNKWTRRLVITKQPASEFYKDEGGKANALEVEVSLIEFNELGESARSADEDFVDIPLRIELFFEDGKRVDDADKDIFRFVGNGYDSVVIGKDTRKAAAQFRLEKVSRRKDGKRFRLRIEVDQDQSTANVSDLTPIFTNAICVLSKRKHHTPTADVANRVKEPPIKLLKRDLQRIEDKLEERVSAVMEELRHMSRQVQLQSELLGKIFLPSTTPSPAPLLPNDGAAMEWLLKSGLMDDVVMKAPPHAHPQPHGSVSSLPYFSVTDDSEERDDDPHASPSSSDSSVVDMASASSCMSSSVLPFAEF